MTYTKNSSKSIKYKFLKLSLGAMVGSVLGIAGYFTILAKFIGPADQYDGLQTVSEPTRPINSLNEDLLLRIDVLSDEQLVDSIEQITTGQLDPAATILQPLLIGELAESDPQRALVKVWELPFFLWDDSLQAVFHEWSSDNLNVALSAASQLVGDLRKLAIEAILQAQVDMDTSTIMELAKVHGVHREVQQLIRTEEALKLLDRPEQAWNSMVNNNLLDDSYLAALNEIASSWKQESGFEIISTLFKDLYHRNRDSFYQILESVTQVELPQAIEWLIGAEVELQEAISDYLFQRHAQLDPLAALQAASKLAHHSTRTNVSQSIASVWAEFDPLGLLQHLEGLPVETRSSAVIYALETLIHDDPELALLQLEKAQSVIGATDDRTEVSLIRAWSKFDPIAAIDWTKDNTIKDSHEYAEMMQVCVRNYTLIDVEQALEIARNEARNSLYLGSSLEAEVIRVLAIYDKLDIALTHLDRVSEPAKLTSFVFVGEGMLRSGRIDEVIQLGSRLLGGEQVEFFESITFDWIRINPTSLIDNLANLPNEDVRVAVAKEIVVYSERFGRVLSDVQLKTIRSLLNNGSEDDTIN